MKIKKPVYALCYQDSNGEVQLLQEKHLTELCAIVESLVKRIGYLERTVQQLVEGEG